MIQGSITRAMLARLIDHTNLNPTASAADIQRLCDEGAENGCASICIASANVRLAADYLRARGSDLVVCSVVGFPHGNMAAPAKAFEAECAVHAGAREIDMVINQGAWHEGRAALVEDDIFSVVAAARRSGAMVKVIFETSALRDGHALTREQQIELLCAMAQRVGASFVKTSTGFGGGGATVADIATMRRSVGSDFGVKASGGVGTYDIARQMIEAGATRIGASKTLAILAGAPA